MKRSVKLILAVAAVLVLTLCVLSGCSDNTQSKIDEAVKAAKEAALKEKDEAVAAVKAELEAAQSKIDEAVKTATEAAAKEKDDAVAAAKAAGDEALKAAQEAADATKAELEAKIAGLEKQVKLYTTPVMDHKAYADAAIDDIVCVETYVQATQSWWDNKITVYAQSKDGAYFIYNMTCSEEESKKLTAGAKIRVLGYKSEWAGEVEITDAVFTVLEGDTFVAEAEDHTDLLGKDELIAHQNEKVLFKGLTVAAQDDGAPFNYKNAENKTDDLYVRFTKGDLTMNFCVEFYLCGQDSEAYKAVEALQVGDVVDIEAYLYWYEGANAHIIKVTKAEAAETETKAE